VHVNHDDDIDDDDDKATNRTRIRGMTQKQLERFLVTVDEDSWQYLDFRCKLIYSSTV
jgi:hypothetical protein